MLEILYLLLPIVVYSDLYQHGAVTCINRQLSYTIVLQPLLPHEQENHVTMIFSVGNLQVFLQKLVQLPLVADTILLWMRALRLYSIEYYNVKPKQ